MILIDPPNDVAVWQVTVQRLPGTTAVGTLDQVRRVVTRFVVVDASVNRVGIKAISLDIVDEKELRDTKHLFDLPPILATILGDLNQAIVGANIDQSFLNR